MARWKSGLFVDDLQDSIRNSKSGLPLNKTENENKLLT